jgi:hypothetical protein
MKKMRTLPPFFSSLGTKRKRGVPPLFAFLISELALQFIIIYIYIYCYNKRGHYSGLERPNGLSFCFSFNRPYGLLHYLWGAGCPTNKYIYIYTPFPLMALMAISLRRSCTLKKSEGFGKW